MRLISKTILYYLLISLPLLLIAGVFSYFLIKSELRDGTDESLMKEKVNAVKLIRSFKEPKNTNLSSDSLSTIKIITDIKSGDVYCDTSIYDKDEQEFIGYRILKSYYTFNNTTYAIRVSKTTVEEDELMEGLLSAFGIIVGFLVFAFFIVNWLLSKTLWKPFYKTLTELNDYDIKKHERHNFETSSTKEFSQLNTALNQMTEKLYSDFVQQKEFTENAAHEMQTPLAIVKANISLLMQSPHLKEEEMNQLQTVENTIKKLSALNKTLLLLTKIENNQFQENVIVSLKETIGKVLGNYSDLIGAKKIQLEMNLESDCKINANPLLADILVSNLFQNAVRHNQEGGKIIVSIKNNQMHISNSGDPLTISKADLFTRFKKNDASKDSLGLGLSIVKSITDTYNYQIVYSYDGSFHNFIVSFS